MNFLDFFWFQGRMGMFFVVEISALLSMFILMWLFRKRETSHRFGRKTGCYRLLSIVSSGRNGHRPDYRIHLFPLPIPSFAKYINGLIVVSLVGHWVGVRIPLQQKPAKRQSRPQRHRLSNARFF
jgi:hypothetical protein